MESYFRRLFSPLLSCSSWRERVVPSFCGGARVSSRYLCLGCFPYEPTITLFPAGSKSFRSGQVRNNSTMSERRCALREQLLLPNACRYLSLFGQCLRWVLHATRSLPHLRLRTLRPRSSLPSLCSLREGTSIFSPIRCETPLKCNSGDCAANHLPLLDILPLGKGARTKQGAVVSEQSPACLMSH